MKRVLTIMLIAAAMAGCKHEDHLKWPKAKGVIVGDGSNGRLGKGYSSYFDVKFIGADGKEYTGQYSAETTFTSKEIGDSLEFYYEPSHPKNLYDEDTYDQMQRQN